MSFPRATGILLHPTCLPSRGEIGDFGPAAYEFLDFLSEARQGLWQVLPLGPPANSNSPYSSTSAFAGNPFLISLERLAERGWLQAESIASLPESSGQIDYGQVRERKAPLLQSAASNFLTTASAAPRARFEKFKSENSWWLEDFVLYDSLRTQHHLQSWSAFPEGVARRDPAALEGARKEHGQKMEIGRVIQFFFWEQWKSLRQACAERSIRVMGDIAIFVDHDSADVWSHQDLYRLKGDMSPEVVSGVPPDAFSATGQRWGNPLYDWPAMKAHGYRWWIQRLRWAATTCDYIRLDQTN
jgi:4-alpha-glucanotransferase